VVELIPESYIARLDLPKIFGRAAPLHVDLGCGDGSFLCALAERMPEKNFLGIERLLGRVRSTCRKSAGIDNIRVIRVETAYAVRYLLPERSVQVFHLLFPDPWPKRRHQRRRVMTPEFLRSVHCALAPQGLLRIATDQLDYFDQMQRLARADRQFAIVDPLLAMPVGADDVAGPGEAGQLLYTNDAIGRRVQTDGAGRPSPIDSIGCLGAKRVDLPLTKFERKFQQQGMPIHRLALRKVSPVM
jgi:tRNA (guanine-N7-)-methyltransferase